MLGIAAIVLLGLPSKASSAVAGWDLRRKSVRLLLTVALVVVGVAEFTFGLAWFQGSDLIQVSARTSFITQAIGIMAMIGGGLFGLSAIQVLVWKLPQHHGRNLGFCTNCGNSLGYQFDRMDGEVCQICDSDNRLFTPNKKVLHCNWCGTKRVDNKSTCTHCGNDIRIGGGV